MKNLGVRLPILVITSLCSTLAMSQGVEKSQRWFGYAGANAALYTKSKIHFTGEDYDFTLHDVVVHENKLVVPALSNFKIGYFFDEHYSVSVGVDRLQYIAKDHQTVTIDGYINDSGTDMDGSYDNELASFPLENIEYGYNHGINYLNSEHTYTDQLFASSGGEGLAITGHWLAGMGGGVLINNADIALLNYESDDSLHFAGLGGSLKAGLNVFFGQHFFVQSELKAGYLNMWNIQTTNNEEDNATQQLFFMQANVLVGWMI